MEFGYTDLSRDTSPAKTNIEKYFIKMFFVFTDIFKQ